MRKAVRFPSWLVVLALTSCLAPSAWGYSNASASHEIVLGKVAGTFVYQPLNKQDEKKKRSSLSFQIVPEGGSPLLYLGIAGISCLGAVAARRKLQKRLKASV